MQEIKTDRWGKYYYWNGQLHREDGPAIEYTDGSKFWYLHDQRHREDGPAIQHFSGLKEWWLQGKQYSEKEYWRVVKLKALW
jgi:hypothetical protein